MEIIFFILVIYLAFEVYCDNTTANCTELRDSFADSNSRFISCSISYSRPITFCESCVDSYSDMLQSYHNMSKYSENGTLCIDNFINLDRLQIVQTLYTNSYNLWERAKCNECFEIKADGTPSPKRSNETLTFDNNYNNLMECINRTDLNDTTVCPNCMEAYVKLSDFYKSISKENEKIGVCMDLVDLMNITQIYWSDKCCKYRHHSEYIFIGSTATVIFITILFYIVTKVSSETKQPTILRQRRLFGGFLNDVIN